MAPLIAWLRGLRAFRVAGGLICLLLIVVAISLIVRFMWGRKDANLFGVGDASARSCRRGL
jgi:hypothetical protein